ncbi:MULTISPECIES: nitrite/sulfite reductase domain-containing protein [Methanobacterium]|uniref:Sulfite reductase n=1 Tax=Methanobacterium bryantii TaxID=2161 RepID=A0A2A2H1P3_METBR|nr:MULTISPECIES: NAD(P)/FAD-dependent oxidoreductase [Methanobacterium]OEC84281.1 sulfite reductase [Methanobacterium sp. A39]PAV03240.1 sulfite reductase [Methanobacterium bryantii]
MKENIPEKGASVQKDMETYAIIPYISGGIVDSAMLRKIADAADKYNIKIMKLTSEGRISLHGIREEDLDRVWEDLRMKPGGHLGKCVRPAKSCIGDICCKKGYQNSVGMSQKINEFYCGVPTPRKLKIAVSGCPNSCGESAVRDIGLIGTGKGWKLLVGGNCGIKPRIGKLLAKNLSDDEVIELIGRIIDYYSEQGVEKRVGAVIEKIGFKKFSQDVLG